MANYKGIEVEDGLRPLIRHMDRVEEYRETLGSLQAVWDNLTLLGQLAGTGTDMSETRQAFGSLTTALINHLATETRRKVVQEIESKAQVAVDIMVRNLFERTADIGFLATDDDIRAFAAFAAANGGNVLQRDELRQRRDAIISRFHEYVRKYSVYRNIILLDPRGNVLAQLDERNAIERCADPLVAESLSTDAAYVESFRHTDLEPDKDVSLVYSYRVTDPQDGTPLGVLCLCFGFENETRRIFANLGTGAEWSIIALLDGEGRVIASSDAYQVPVGAPLHARPDATYHVVSFAGREYLAATRPTKGYQGYRGPGWMGHVMVPIHKAFSRNDAAKLAMVEGTALAAVMSSTSLFSAELRRIPEQAEKIQRELNRSVWNGNVRQSSDRRALNPAFSKVLLWEISNTGLKTQDVFERSIGNLQETVVSSILVDCEFLALLAIDIMDRNLYERSDDCRWWAQTTAFREALASPGDAGYPQVADILAYINGLYTVYETLLVFDKEGRVIAVSNGNYRNLVGTRLDDEWVKRTLALKNSQEYAVSGFQRSPFYRNEHTYVYAAAVRDPNEESRVVGGIGIVFDSAPQFAAMLNDALPRDEDGVVLPGCFGVYLDRERRVISSTSAEVVIGERMPVDDAFVSMKNGSGLCNIVEYRNTYFAVGSRMSAGYREYKGPDDAYRNDVVALIFVPLGVASGRPVETGRSENTQLMHRTQGQHIPDSTEIATFYIGEEWFGIPSSRVVEAIEAAGVTPLPGMPDYVRGVVMFQESPILVFDVRNHLRFGAPVDPDTYRQIVIVRAESGEPFGILVHRLGEIPEIPNDRIESINNIFPGESVLVQSLVKPAPGQERGDILVVLSAERIRRKLIEAEAHALPTSAPPDDK